MADRVSPPPPTVFEDHVAVVGGAMDQQCRPIGFIVDDFAGHGGVTASSQGFVPDLRDRFGIAGFDRGPAGRGAVDRISGSGRREMTRSG